MAGKKIPKKSSLSKLCPRIDSQGIMKCNIRLQFAECRTMGDFLLYCQGVIGRQSWQLSTITSCSLQRATRYEDGRTSVVSGRDAVCNTDDGPLPKIRLRFTFRASDQTAVDYVGPLITIQGSTWASATDDVAVGIYMFINPCSASRSCIGA